MDRPHSHHPNLHKKFFGPGLKPVIAPGSIAKFISFNSNALKLNNFRMVSAKFFSIPHFTHEERKKNIWEELGMNQVLWHCQRSL